MKRKLKLKKDKLFNQKCIYIILIVLIIIGVLAGLIYPLFLSSSNTEVLSSSISSFFNNVINNQLNYYEGFKNSLVTNSLLVIAIWLLGISLIGIPIVLIILIYKGFILGFSISSIIKVYGFKGVIGALTYVFPGMFISLLAQLLLSFYSVGFSVKLFKYLFLKENLNFKLIMKKYFKILYICSFMFLIASISDVYLSPILMNLFTFLIK